MENRIQEYSERGNSLAKKVSQVMKELEVFKGCVCHCGVCWTMVREAGLCHRQTASKSPLGLIPKAKKASGSLQRPHKVNMLCLLVLIIAEAFGLQGPQSSEFILPSIRIKS